jgi:hypothetical protein
MEHKLSDARPGRQLVVFMFFLNLAQWAVVTFVTQKMGSNPLATLLFGHKAWVVVQRIALPPTIFLRFVPADCYLVRDT